MIPNIRAINDLANISKLSGSYLFRDSSEELHRCILENMGCPLGPVPPLSAPLHLSGLRGGRGLALRLHDPADGRVLAHRGAPAPHHLHDPHGPPPHARGNVNRYSTQFNIISQNNSSFWKYF